MLLAALNINPIEVLHLLALLVEAAKSNPQITVAFAIVLLAGILITLLMRRDRRDDPLSIRKD